MAKVFVTFSPFPSKQNNKIIAHSALISRTEIDNILEVVGGYESVVGHDCNNKIICIKFKKKEEKIGTNHSNNNNSINK